MLALNTVAQERTCSLQINIFAYAKNAVVEGAFLKLTNLSAGGDMHTGLRRGRFEGPVSGKYILEVKKDEYDPRIREFEIDCDLADHDGVLTRRVYLGDPLKDLPELEIKDGKVVNRTAIYLPKPIYPAAMRGTGTGREVPVRVLIDEDGNVVSGRAEDSLFGQAAVRAAMGAKFQPARLRGQVVKVLGDIIYNFVP